MKTTTRRYPIRSRQVVEEKKEDDDHHRDDDSTEGTVDAASSSEHPAKPTQDIRTTRKASSQRITGTLLRVLLLDIPLLVVFALLISTSVLQTIRDEYLLPLVELQEWTPERMEKEVTYYYRSCDQDDVSAEDMEDLLVTEDMDTDDAVEKMLIHGAMLIPKLLSEDTASELRDFIVKQNKKGEDMVNVATNENRWSFYIKPDHDPSIPKAMNEIFTNSRFVPMLEAVLGDKPTLLDFSTITSAYGAEAQSWHRDIITARSAGKYSRSYLPTYSLFIPLQNTTSAMGATGIVPGMHMCSNDRMDYSQIGFQASGEADNFPAGWGALVNQQTPHRGEAHVDPNGPERALLVITFAPRPRLGEGKVETRMIPTGGLWSQHWSSFGHTAADFANIPKYMAMPWRILRALGIYKASDRQWGWDLVSQQATQIANADTDILYEAYEVFMRNHGFLFLPSWLYGDVTLDYQDGKKLWIDLMSGTLEKCRAALKKLHLAFLGLYVLLLILGRLMRSDFKVRKSLSRLLVLHLVVLVGSRFSLHVLSKNNWAKNIKSGRSFRLAKEPRGLELPATLPLTQDVLIPDDFQSEYLASYTRILDFAHPGNKEWNEMLKEYSFGYHSLPPAIQGQLSSNVIEWTRRERQGRILGKNRDGEWAELTRDMSIYFAHKELMKASNVHVKEAVKWIDYLLSETKYGYWRDTSMHYGAIPSMLRDLQGKLLRLPHDDHAKSSVLPAGVAIDQVVGLTLSIQSTLPTFSRRPLVSLATTRTGIPPQLSQVEPYFGAWLGVGDVVEAFDKETKMWYRGQIISASADRASWGIEFDDGGVDKDCCRHCVMPYMSYIVGERAIWLDEDDGSRPYHVRIIQAYPDDTYDVVLFETKELLQEIPASLLRHNYTPLPSQLHLGTRVLVLDQDQELDGDIWYPGTIVNVHDNETVDVWHDDGEYFDQEVRSKDLILFMEGTAMEIY